MAGTDFLHIPAAIRGEYIPFRFPNGSYSFKKENGINPIYPFSANLDRFFANDSFLPDTVKDYNSFVSLIPTVQIREYQPDARLTQTLKWFSYFKKGIDAGMAATEGDGSKGMAEVRKTALEKIKQIQEDLKRFTSGEASLLNGIGSLADYTDVFGIGGSAPGAVLTVPWILYYQLNTTTTTNVYEVPVLWNNGNALFKSNGTYGWKEASEYSLAQILGGSSNNAVSQILNTMGLQEIRSHRMPVFNPEGGFTSDQFDVTFTLVNDSVAAACNNFIFLHNLIGQNRWLQYGFVQASASVYDVLLPGANRYWMCSGNFEVIPKGILRVPSSEVLEGIKSKGKPQDSKKANQNLVVEVNEGMNVLSKINVLDVEMAALGSKNGTSQYNIDQANAELNGPPNEDGTYGPNKRKKEDIEKEIAQETENIQSNEAKIMEMENKKNGLIAERNRLQATKTRNEAYLMNTKNSDYILEKVKIPDAYEVKLHFTSLLPDNFNNFLYGWRAGVKWDIMKSFNPGESGIQRNWVFEEMVDKIVAAFK